MRRSVFAGCAAALALLLAAPAVRADEKSYSGLTVAEFDKIFDEMKGKGWHPVTIVCHGGKETKFDITWDSRKNVEWFLYYDMSPDGFAKRKEELGKKGFKVTSETNYKVGGEERISAIWEKK